jgi:uroporphyrinogen-III decarboxylase
MGVRAVADPRPEREYLLKGVIRRAYCGRLIGRVGDDGGSILGSGCGVPCNVKPGNFRAMIETGKNTKA